MTFRTAIIEMLKESLNNSFDDNYDYYRFGARSDSGQTSIVLRFTLREIISRMTPCQYISSIVKNYQITIEKFEYLYSRLADDASKQLLVKILAYRILGHKKVKLPTNTANFWNATEYLEEKVDKENVIKLDFLDWTLHLFDLALIGWPIRVYSRSRTVYNAFIAKQYEYHSCDTVIKVEQGDIVIDAGGGWGDTALRFAYQAGKYGRVYSFEIVPANRDIMHENIKLNTWLGKRIDIVSDALWNESGLFVPVNINGPASNINTEGCGINVRTISIDDFAADKKLPKVSFIKMDIEGAELQALKGAEKTIRKYNPKLAISLYHRIDDFINIPAFIESLGLGYRYYIGHYTIHTEETILFATIDGNQF